MTLDPQLAYVFPGQGSQQVGMLADIAAEWPHITETFAAASQVLGYDLWQLVQDGPQQELNLTENSQPALLTASVAIWRVLRQSRAPMPAMLAGHSLGEWSALVCAGVLDFEDAVRLVQLRGRYMQEAVPAGVGGMAAIIGLSDEIVIDCCERAADSSVVAAVNFNSPGQVVIAGEAVAVDRAINLCKEAGAKRALPLPVSAPFHTNLMKPAADRLASEIREVAFAAPQIPIVHNVHAKTESDPTKIKSLMVEQVCAPVKWVDCVKALAQSGVTTTVECGAGKVLTGLTRRIVKGMSAHSTETVASLRDVINGTENNK